MVGHILEYSRSSRAKCHGSYPCKGTPIEMGALRYGHVARSVFGESVQWRHWGCVTPQILSRLATPGVAYIAGFQDLRAEDKEKVRVAVLSRKINPADVPASAQLVPVPPTLIVRSPEPASPPPKKRKTSTSDNYASQPSGSNAVPIWGTQGTAQPISVEDEDDDNPEEVIDELYCVLNSNVVGVQYYQGLVGAGEKVRLVREPHNAYDRNAIQVKNINDVQVGHLPRQVAAKLASLLDGNLINVEGEMLQGNLVGFRGYSLSIKLRFYGPSLQRDQLEPLLVWATPGQRGFSTRDGQSAIADSGQGNRRQTQAASAKQQEAQQKALELKDMLNNLQRVDDESRRSSLLDTLCSTEDVLNLPLHPSPPGIISGELKVDLLKHQSQALQWCIEHEYPTLPQSESEKPVQFWQLKKSNNKTHYYNIATLTPRQEPPTLGRGAICADSMGLGKTLTMLALIIATKKDVPTKFSNSTLIVVPLSVMSNWEQQIQEHCTPGTISSCVYYGNNRSMPAEDLQKFDVVITTYQVVVGDLDTHRASSAGSTHKKRRTEGNLFQVQWKRVVLDEGHYIRNPITKMAQSVCALSAERRWFLSGTPIINSLMDLRSILTFLRICQPLGDDHYFKHLLLRPLKYGLPEGTELLRALMSHICIRRTKEMQDSNGNHFVPLPPVEMTVVPVTLDPEARALYDDIEKLSAQKFRNIMASAQTQSNILSMLTRLRQSVLHPGLVPANYLEQLRASEDIAPGRAIQITPEDKIRLQKLLAQAIEDCEECPVCFNILIDPRITSCAHTFCFPCIKEVITRDPRCPMDRRTIGIGDLIEPAPPTELTQAPVCQEQEDEASGRGTSTSAKIDQLIHLLRLTPATEKSLVFSQFTSFLDKIADNLAEHGISYVRFDGQMSAKKRQEALQKFSRPVQEGDLDAPAREISSSSRRSTRNKQPSVRLPHIENDNAPGDVNDANDNDDDGDYSDHEEKAKSSLRESDRKGKGKARASNSANEFGDNPKVMLLSLKAGAFGLNLTVANNVYLMDPWWQEGIESQAIDRCNRIGQKRTVHVYQLIAENTVESKVIEIQERKKKLIQQAFSGIKRTETLRQKKEARLQDLIELFGMRQNEGPEL